MVFNDEQLQTLSDLGKIQRIYKLNSPTSSKGPQRKKGQQSFVLENSSVEGVDERQEAEATILGLIALRGAS